jgi:hypothetical protein
MSYSNDQWKDFHYGKKKPAKSDKTIWELWYGNNVVVRGAYALCRWKMQQMLSNGEIPTKFKNLLKIK